MKEVTLVFGHKTPDTDSICSAIAYAELKEKCGEKNIKPMRLGKINKETTFALDYFGRKSPDFLKNVKPQLDDLEIDSPEFIYMDEPIKKAMEIMDKKSYSNIPVLNRKKQLKGIVYFSDIARNYFEISDEELFLRYKTGFANLVEVLDAKVVYGNYPFENINGRIYTYSTLAKNIELNSGDIVIKPNTEDIEKVIKESKAGCIIIPEHCGDGIVIKGDYNCAVLTVELSFFRIIKLITQSIAISNIVEKEDYKYFKTNDYIDGVKSVMKNSDQHFFPVVNSKHELEGIVTERDLINYSRKKVILVDHNEIGQSVDGIEKAKILEIIDHHRIAEIHTVEPIYFRSEPVGCTSTIIYKMYKEKNIFPEKNVAGIMLSAIISDTLLFKSPTTTKEDISAARELANISGVDINEYGLKLLYAGADIENKDIDELVENDIKEFIFDDKKIMVSQFITTSIEPFVEISSKIESFLEKYCEQNEIYAILFAVTDIIKEGSYIFTGGTGKKELYQVFNCEDANSRFIKGMLSRKKQIIPEITKFFND